MNIDESSCSENNLCVGNLYKMFSESLSIQTVKLSFGNFCCVLNFLAQFELRQRCAVFAGLNWAS